MTIEKGLFVITDLFRECVMIVFLANQETADAQKCRIVRIHQEKGGAGTVIRVEPETLHISKGTCVIWINWVKAQEVSVVFREDGKNCRMIKLPLMNLM